MGKTKLDTSSLEYTLTGVKVRKTFLENSLLALSHIFRFISYFIGFAIVIYIVAAIIPYFEGYENYPALKFLDQIMRRTVHLLNTQIPTKIGKFDASAWIIIIGLLILKGTFERNSDRIKDKSYLMHFRRKYELWKSQQPIKKGSKLTHKLDDALSNLENAKPKDREEILRQFIETKRKLDAMGRDLAFLSIDVVDSTKMKEGEEKAFVEHDFKEFKRFVEGVLINNNVMKTAWTPDGVMACFEKVDQAVNAGREVIIGLEAFNRNIKTIKKDFSVRAGVNSGFVYYDDELPLEEIADRVIDIAGHFQKHARPNAIWIAKPSIEPLATRDGFQPINEVVDGYEVYEWKKG
ncbi:MAG: hypothetical protein IGBAC_1985 [Ignavibacteriae bacterium]|nr:MAG: hypothetical protein IGBAC_1985 [Ignavibacteriota bacterium]